MIKTDVQNISSTIVFFSLALTWTTSFFTRLFSVIRYESVIHEFDPWFNYRASKYLVQNGWYKFLNWFDETAWYPLGRVVGGTVYPGLMATSAFIYNVLHKLNIPIDIRNVCVFFAPMFSGACAVATYLFAKECKDSTAGLLAALFIGIAPGYISRSVAGSYDNEGISIFLLVFTFWLWLKALRLGSPLYATYTAISYFYMVASWGGYVYIINMIPLHVLALVVMGRYSHKVYTSYSTFYVIGTLTSMLVPFVGFNATSTSEHMGALGVFGLIQLVAFFYYVRSLLTKEQFIKLLFGALLIIVGLSLPILGYFASKGHFTNWSGRYYSLWDTGYAKKHIPIIASVSEHQPTAWSSMFFDMHLLLLLFPAGIYYCGNVLSDAHIFVILYAVTSSYFAGVMVRLILTMTPIVCVSAAIAISNLLDVFTKVTKPAKIAPEKGDKAKSKVIHEGNNSAPIIAKPLVVATFWWILTIFVAHCTWVTSNSYSSPSIVLASSNSKGERTIIDDFREAYYWLSKNTKEDAKIFCWWDYGYQIAGMGNRTVMVDNNTWNNTHIAMVGRIMGSNEDDAYELLKKHDIDYVLMIYGGLIGYSGDDMNKFLWMIRIAENVFPNEVKEESYYTSQGEFRVDDRASQKLLDSIMYKLNYYRVNEYYGGRGMDRVRQTHISSKNIKLHTMDEVFTSEHWIVRVFKLKDKDPFGRTFKDVYDFEK